MNNDTIYRVAMPVLYNERLQSEVSHHFGKAPGFIVVNSDGSEPIFLDTDEARGPSECAPIQAIVNAGTRMVLAKSMGRGALQRCHGHGLMIMEAKGDTVADVLMSLMTDKCPDFSDKSLCAHHEHHHANGEEHCH